jgi:hypothetical protein
MNTLVPWLGTMPPAEPTDPKSLAYHSHISPKATKTKTRHQKPQLAIPVAIVERASAYHQAPNVAHVQAKADLISVAFFFLLRVGR